MYLAIFNIRFHCPPICDMKDMKVWYLKHVAHSLKQDDIVLVKYDNDW